MARPLRVEYAGALYHVMNRGNRRERVFRAMNRREKSSGHLFQGRFKAQLVEGAGYVDMLSRYIHLNPVRVKSAQSLPTAERRWLLAEFRWSSFPAAIGLVSVPG